MEHRKRKQRKSGRVEGLTLLSTPMVTSGTRRAATSHIVERTQKKRLPAGGRTIRRKEPLSTSGATARATGEMNLGLHPWTPLHRDAAWESKLKEFDYACSDCRQPTRRKTTLLG